MAIYDFEKRSQKLIKNLGNINMFLKIYDQININDDSDIDEDDAEEESEEDVDDDAEDNEPDENEEIE